MRAFINWFHHLFNPHCEECAHERECKTCETMRSILEVERFEKKQLLERLLELTAPEVHERVEIKPETLKARAIPWRVRKEMLETEDRAKAKILHEQAQERGTTVEDLEKELGVSNAN